MSLVRNLAIGAALSVGVGCSGSGGEASPESTVPAVTAAPTTLPESTTTTTEVTTTTEAVRVAPFDVFEDDNFSLRKGNLPAQTCAALALQLEILGPEDLPHEQRFQAMADPNDLRDPMVSLLASSKAVFDSLSDENGVIPFDPSLPGMAESFGAAIGASTTAEVAANAFEPLYEMGSKDFYGEEGEVVKRDIDSLLDQAREETNRALESGCDYLITYLPQN